MDAEIIKQRRRWLTKAIKGTLVPRFEERGFDSLPLPPPVIGPMDRRLVTSHPFGRLRRKSARGFDLVEIQLAAPGRAAFRICFGLAPLEGVEGTQGTIAAENALVGWLAQSYDLYASPRFRTWFAVRRRFWDRRHIVEADYNALVEQVSLLLPEVESALRDGKIGPHVRRIYLRRPSQRA